MNQTLLRIIIGFAGTIIIYLGFGLIFKEKKK